MYFLGVDAGGTKTSFLLSDENGRILARRRSGSGDFFNKGAEGIRKLLAEEIPELCKEAGIHVSDLAAAGLGFPGYGEKEDSEREINAVCEAVIGKGKAVCNCDCYLGWAGSLAMEPGINIVAGTGSICYGVNSAGKAARTSGWGAFCDEGSCAWIGQRAIEAFTKQADGRLPKTAIYEIFRDHFKIRNDMDFIYPLNHEIAAKRSETAKLQMLLLKACQSGDPIAAKIYRDAAAELALSIKAAAEKLNMPNGYRVSYSGGLFQAGAHILAPLQAEVSRYAGSLAAPKFSPDQGALLMAYRHVIPQMDFSNFKFKE